MKGLGLKRRHQTVVVQDTPESRGMIAKVSHLVEVAEVKE
jgi:large subunit ribosomal protein L30